MWPQESAVCLRLALRSHCRLQGKWRSMRLAAGALAMCSKEAERARRAGKRSASLSCAVVSNCAAAIGCAFPGCLDWAQPFRPQWKGCRVGIFNSLIVAYLFLGGAGGGALVVLSLLEIANAPRIAARKWLLPSEFFARAWTACAVALILSVTCLLADVGRVERAVLLFASPVPSPISFGAWSLAAALVLAIAFALVNLFSFWDSRAAMAIPAGIAGTIAGSAVVVYTGVLLCTTPSVLAWETPLIPLLFGLSGVSCGVALCLGSGAFVECRDPLVGPIAELARFDGVVIIFEAVCVAVYVVWLLASPATFAAGQAFVSGSLRWLFWLGLVTCGLGIPFVLERLLTFGNSRSQLLWIALFVLVGGFALRYLAVGASAFDATQTTSLAAALASPQ